MKQDGSKCQYLVERENSRAFDLIVRMIT